MTAFPKWYLRKEAIDMLNVVLPVPPLAEKNETTIITQSLLPTNVNIFFTINKIIFAIYGLPHFVTQ